MRRRIAVLIFPEFQLLDAAGPIGAFEIAHRLVGEAYEIVVTALEPGLVASSAGATMQAQALPEGPLDTLLVAGGNGTRELVHCPKTRELIQAAAPRARRVASVCSGAFLLAEAGLLDGRRATTHWHRCPDFARRYPQVRLEPDRIFVRDDDVWTSAGITAGIDLALALIEEDLGAEVARQTAQQLVVYHRRPGGQSQFSALVEMGGASGRFARLLAWMRDNLARRLTVEAMAEAAAMSPRHFARAFQAETGLTPAKALERLRLEVARERVEASAEPIEQVAAAAGFGDPERMRRAFLRAFGQPPQALRRAARA
ncbi:GlxA family transcriptional regulator [Phenylobacterium terrae]|uniref:GlxA family transcriptional regulator n=1 Tax=Phenylobacterium terrae TaxID=2665495 RepID=A0ABW4N370_9CAUL